MKKILCASFIIISLFLSGCTTGPSKSKVEEVIVKHFEARDYHVLELEIGSITSIPPGDKQYMGTESCIVNIALISLEFKRDIGGERAFKRGQYISFSNVRVRLKKLSPKSEEWVVADISGIPLP